MKIKEFIYILIVGTALTISSCKKEFLDEKPPTALPILEAIKNETDMADAVNGMYSALRSSSFFGRDIPVLGDVLADNAYVFSSNSGRYLQQMTYNYIAGSAEAANIYAQGYYAILQANRVIYAGSILPATNNSNQLRGEAYATRALAYLELVNFFATPFTVNPTADGVPLVTTPTFVSGPLIKPSRASVTDVYTKILSDLDSAYTLMPATNTGITAHGANSNYIAKYAAKAIQARAYLYKGDYTKAIEAAQLVVQSGGYTLATSANYLGYWSSPAATTTKLETIFELALNNATNSGTNGLDYIYAQAGYGDILSYDALYNLYTATDIRRSLFLTTSPTKSGTVYVNNKYSNVSNANDKDDIKIIRYSEVLLTLAESYARSGDNVNSLLFLNQVAQRRDPSFTGYTSTGATLQDNIVNERRKELAFEGLRYFDLTRLNLPVNRPVQTRTAPTTTTLPVTSSKRILPIPQAETDANPNVKQNPGY
ncbi:MAG: RagB/SusD family nutrient uptake outer membrane protein [Sphingobacteriaceae bacterium]|nr:MAG: RagB/SusD family nutrient uptake outer membrane protein [Sphingobacteriaceae bacterium]